MRILLDCRYKTESGGSTYVKNLVKELLELDGLNTYFLVRYKSQKFENEERAEIITSPSSALKQIFWDMFKLPKIVLSKKIDVAHKLKFPGFASLPCATILTKHSIYDPVNFPVSWKMRLFIRFFSDPAFRKANRIIAVSNFVKNKLSAQLNIQNDKIKTVYHGISHNGKIEPLKRNRDHILCLGNVTQVKNHITAIKAFNLIKDKHDVDLVIAGSTKGNYAKNLIAKVKEMGMEDRIQFLGYVKEPLPLIMGSKVVVFPSLTEGFGFAMLEAFKCGVPVIASNRGSLPEIGLPFCLFVDALDYDALANYISFLFENPDSKKLMVNAGFERMKDFTWRKSAELHLETYKECLNS